MSIENKQQQLKIIIKMYTKLISLYQQLWQKMYGGKIPCVLHHSGTESKKTWFEAINRNHRERGYPKSKLGFWCAYNWVIDYNGDLWQARGKDETGQATRTFKKFHWDIMVIGSFDYEIPSKMQLETLENLLGELTIKDKLGSVSLHNNFLNTICPGKNLEIELQKMKMTNNVL